MNKKIMKKIICIFIFIILMLSFSQVVFADWTPKIDELTSGDVKKAGNMAIDVFGSIINIIQLFGMGIAVLILVFIGIQYVAAAPSQKAEIKNKTINFIIGAVLIFSASAILQLVKIFIDGNIK